ncbi:MAG TPA: DinB family protein [Verrucomicrobiae bacterium]|nr:DinB family protein [Verrucomicrobiae bacterium]
MPIRDAILPEFDNEMAGTRKTLERVPEDKPDWKPHDKSMKLGRLAAHLAELPTWASLSLAQDSLDIAPPGAAPRDPAVMTSRRELLDAFDKNVASARAAIAAASDETFMQPWTLLKGGQKIMTIPRIAVVRNFVLNHAIHHRAQLGVYLRLNDIPVPSIYGPSADENPF